jgi:hypothetical protein
MRRALRALVVAGTAAAVGVVATPASAAATLDNTRVFGNVPDDCAC